MNVSPSLKNPKVLRVIKSDLWCFPLREDAGRARSASEDNGIPLTTMTSSGNIVLHKISHPTKNKNIKVLVLGQGGVGKTAMTVRFLTKRFICEYDPTLEQIYPPYLQDVDGENATFEIFDTAGQAEDTVALEQAIKWADAYILVYSITDQCSFDDIPRLKFLISLYKKHRRLGSRNSSNLHDIPFALVGNKVDLEHDRVVSEDQGIRLAQTFACPIFHEISVRNSYSQVVTVFSNLCREWRYIHGKNRSPLSSPFSLRRNEGASSSDEPEDSKSHAGSVIHVSLDNSPSRTGSFMRNLLPRRNARVDLHAVSSLLQVNDHV